MPAAAPPPAAPPAPKVDAAGIVPPAQVSASSIAPPIDSQRPKAGSAREAIYKNLEKYAKPPAGEEPPAAPAATPAEPPKAAEPPAQAPAEPPKPSPAEPPKPGEPPEPDRSLQKPTKDFWRAFDSWKERAVKAETQLSEATKGAIPEAEKKSLQERIEKAEARAKELEDHIRYVDYAQHPEFKEKYQKPYEQAWDRAMEEVSQIRIKEADGSVRQAGIADLSAIVDAPLMDARVMATQLFGDFADDVMAFRKEIRGLNAAQTQALQDAKKNGAERQKLTQEQFNKQMEAVAKEIQTNWNKFTEEGLKHPKIGKYLKPVDGDQQINEALKKGRELVEQAFNENPKDPNLTPEQRSIVVKRHAAVFNRAFGFGRLAIELERALLRAEKAEKEVEGYKKSTPGTVGQPSGQPSNVTELRGMSRMRAELEKIAKPA